MIQKTTSSGLQHELLMLLGEKFSAICCVLYWIRRDFSVIFDVAM